MNPRNFVFSSVADSGGAREATNGAASIRKYLLRCTISVSFLLLFTAMFFIGPTPDSASAQIALTPIATAGPIDPGDIFDPSIPVNLLGAVIEVNRVDDLADTNVGDGFCDVDDVLFGEQCSLRAAIEEANFMSGRLTAHQINFDLTGTGPFVINIGSQLPSISSRVNINGTTQDGTSCPTRVRRADLQVVIDSSSAAIPIGNGLMFNETASGSTLQGVAVGGFTSRSVRLFGDNNLLICNHIGVDASGASMGSTGAGVEILGTGNVIGGASEHANRNVISGHGMQGILISGDDNLVENNFIGTTPNGRNARGNVGGGIEIKSNGNDIGGTAERARNVISGNGSNDNGTFGGIRIASAENNSIAGNTVGLARGRNAPIPNIGNGVEVIGGSEDNIVGPTNGGNEIAFNSGHGVFVENRTPVSLSLQNTIRGNAIYSNDGLGIELAGDLPPSMIGPDANDILDVDTGPNNHQNYPILTSAIVSGTVDGTLESMANMDYIVEIFVNDSCDPSGHGEGQTFLDSDLVQTDGSGQGNVSFALSAPVGSFITATATDPVGNTSEFSPCIEVAASVASLTAPEAPKSDASEEVQAPAKDAVVRSTPVTAVLPPEQSETESESKLFLPLVESE